MGNWSVNKRPETLVSAFGEQNVAITSLKGYVRFNYDTNTRLYDGQSANGGSFAVSGGFATVATSTDTAGRGQMASNQVLAYSPGQGSLVRFTAVFTTGVANNTQAIGMGDLEDGLFFGFDGTSFGILRRVGGTIERRTIAITAGAGTATGNITINLESVGTLVAVVQTDTIAQVVAKIVATDFTSAGGGWEANSDDNVNISFTARSAGAKSGTFSFVDTDTTGVTAGAFSTLITGVAATDNWIPQTTWNRDVMDGTGKSGMTLDQTKGNVYQIQYQWLGFGGLKFYIEDSITAAFTEVHVIEYANINTTPSLNNPTLPVCLVTTNSGNTSDVTVKSSSAGFFTEGVSEKIDDTVWGQENDKTLAAATETVIFTLRNKSIYRAKTNRIRVEPLLLTLVSDGTKSVTFRVYLNAVSGGSPVFTDTDTLDSVTDCDFAGTTISGGIFMAPFKIAKIDNLEVDLERLGILMRPGEKLTITAESTLANDVGIGLTWRELF